MKPMNKQDTLEDRPYLVMNDGGEGDGSGAGEGGDNGEHQDLDESAGSGGTGEERKYAGKFNSPEDLEKAYLESQRGLTEKSMSLAEMERTLAATYGGNVEDYDFSGQDGYEDDTSPEETALRDVVGGEIQKALLPFKIQSDISRMQAEHPDFEEKLPQIVETLKGRPDLQNVDDPLDLAYLIVTASTAKADGKKEAYDTIGKKQAGFLQSGSKAGQGEDGAEITRAWIASLNPEQYEKNRDKILAATRAGKITK